MGKVSKDKDCIILKKIRHDSTKAIVSDITNYELVFKNECSSLYHKVQVQSMSNIENGFNKVFNYKGFAQEDIDYFEKGEWHSGLHIIGLSTKCQISQELHEFDSAKFYIRLGFTKNYMKSSIDSLRVKLQLYNDKGQDSCFIMKFNTDNIQW